MVASDSISLTKLGRHHHRGTTFGIPWPKSKYFPGQLFGCTNDSGEELPLQSWVTGYWPDGSIKWTGHAISSLAEEYFVRPVDKHVEYKDEGIKVVKSENEYIIDTGKIRVSFPTSGGDIINSITNSSGMIVGCKGHLILSTRSSAEPEDDAYSKIHVLKSQIESVTVDEGPIRTLVTIRGTHPSESRLTLPFTLRFYLYAHSSTLKLNHTIIYNGDHHKDFIQSIGLRFQIPLHDEKPYNRHIAFGGVDGVVDGGIFHEAVQGVSGLWKSPGEDVLQAQREGKSLDGLIWENGLKGYMKYVPCWNEYTLSQLSPDGYTFKKRTKHGCSWVSIPGGTHADGFVYLGTPSGGLGIGMRYFWERHPTSLDIKHANTDTGEMTLWLYSPAGEVLDLRPYHDGLGLSGYEEQLEAMSVTYEDWEEGFDTPFGIARTSEIYLTAFDEPSLSGDLSEITQMIRNPPVLVPDRTYIANTHALGSYWSPSPPFPSPSAQTINTRLSFLSTYYHTQSHQRKWTSFLSHGDIMHTYDPSRHTWRYDIGGYAWSNSELSPDLFFWYYFLYSGSEEIYRFAEALTRHTSEVDMYHMGPWKGLGTRHGVTHWGDSCKQVRVSSGVYKRVWFFLSGGDERLGEVIDEMSTVDQSFNILDPYRKVRKDGYTPSPSSELVSISLGTDWSALAAIWYLATERRSPYWETSLRKLLTSMKGIAKLKNGFVTGMVLFNPSTGEIFPPAQDSENKGVVKVSHLSAVFGLFEICAELVENFGTQVQGFQGVWVDYCRFFNAAPEEQERRYGVGFGRLILKQGHSRLTAYAAKMLNDEGLRRRAWEEFYTDPEGYTDANEWETKLITDDVPVPVEEVSWVSTNVTSLYGLAAIQLLALLGTD